MRLTTPTDPRAVLADSKGEARSGKHDPASTAGAEGAEERSRRQRRRERSERVARLERAEGFGDSPVPNEYTRLARIHGFKS